MGLCLDASSVAVGIVFAMPQGAKQRKAERVAPHVEPADGQGRREPVLWTTRV